MVPIPASATNGIGGDVEWGELMRHCACLVALALLVGCGANEPCNATTCPTGAATALPAGPSSPTRHAARVVLRAWPATRRPSRARPHRKAARLSSSFGSPTPWIRRRVAPTAGHVRQRLACGRATIRVSQPIPTGRLATRCSSRAPRQPGPPSMRGTVAADTASAGRRPGTRPTSPVGSSSRIPGEAALLDRRVGPGPGRQPERRWVQRQPSAPPAASRFCLAQGPGAGLRAGRRSAGPVLKLVHRYRPEVCPAGRLRGHRLRACRPGRPPAHPGVERRTGCSR
jgi:hypothetical protein